MQRALHWMLYLPTTAASSRAPFSAGIDYVIVRAWHSYGAPDTNAPPMLKAAKRAGFETHAYMFPCPGKNATEQVHSTIKFLQSSGAPFDKLWFDIETDPSSGCGWSSDKAHNCDFLGEMVRAVKDAGQAAGVYISTYMQESIMGSCTAGSSLDLWYAHYDNVKAFSDFSSFGGWSKPVMKQYDDGQKSPLCGNTIDRDWMP